MSKETSSLYSGWYRGGQTSCESRSEIVEDADKAGVVEGAGLIDKALQETEEQGISFVLIASVDV